IKAELAKINQILHSLGGKMKGILTPDGKARAKNVIERLRHYKEALKSIQQIPRFAVQTDTTQAGMSQTGTSQAGTSQGGTSQAGMVRPLHAAMPQTITTQAAMPQTGTTQADMPQTRATQRRATQQGGTRNGTT